MTLQSMSEGAIFFNIVDVVLYGLLVTGHTILSADHPDHPAVREVNGREPDIISRDPDGIKVITAVETELTVRSLPARDRFRAFAAARDERTHFHVAVPESCLETARAFTRDWEVDVDAWWSDFRY